MKLEYPTVEEPQDEFPDELDELRMSLQQELSRDIKNVRLGKFAGLVDSTWGFDVYYGLKGSSRLLFSYDILPTNLSTDHRETYQHFQLLESCMVDEYASKKMLYKNFFLEPGCGNVNNKEEENVVDHVYAALKKLGAIETKNDFFSEQIKSRN